MPVVMMVVVGGSSRKQAIALVAARVLATGKHRHPGPNAETMAYSLGAHKA